MRGLVVAGGQSGSGKTTLSLALMAAFRRRGLTVQGFKVGPDFIDPGHHALATGRPSHNLDGWMLPAGENLAIFQRHAAHADLAVVEGVMGLYDGFSPQGEAGSTAEMAKLLGLPVLLVVDGRAMARSLAAVAGGFHAFDRELSWLGLAANRVGGRGHAALLAEVMEQVPEMRFWGGLAKDRELIMPERHLGLITAQEGGFDQVIFDHLADWLEQAVDLDRLWADLPETAPSPPSPQPVAGGPVVRLGVARDRAFCFYYQENLRRLERAGAELVFFSPLDDPAPPPDLGGLYLGGGYPETHARRLSGNRAMRAELSALAHGGLPVYAECGGMMYLGRSLEELGGRTWPMCDLLPIETTMLERRRSLGYREVTTMTHGLLGPAGARARGHEFHYSEVRWADPSLYDGAYGITGRKGPVNDTHAYCRLNILASYVHLHFGSNPDLAPSLVGFCRRHKEAINA